MSRLAWALQKAVRELAVSTRTEPRFTRDVDLAVAVEDDGSAERFVRGLLQGGWQVLAQVEQTATLRLATIRAVPLEVAPRASSPARARSFRLLPAAGRTGRRRGTDGPRPGI